MNLVIPRIILYNTPQFPQLHYSRLKEKRVRHYLFDFADSCEKSRMFVSCGYADVVEW